MALTLRTAITANDTVFDVLGTDSIAHGQLKSLGDEYVYIRTASVGSPNFGEPAYWRLGVERGTLGTTAVSHAAAVTLGAVDLTASPGGASNASDITLDPTVAGESDVQAALEAVAAGAAQTVSLVAVDIAFDTPGLENPLSGQGAEILTIPAGTLFRIVPVLTEIWDASGELTFVAGEDSENATVVIASVDPGSLHGDAFVAAELLPGSYGVSDFPKFAMALQETILCVAFYPSDEETATQGAATVLVLFATPS